MAKVVPFQRPMRADEFEAEVRDRSRFTHEIIWTVHIKERMLERGITERQVLNTLRKGTLKKDPKENKEFGTYEGTFCYHGTGREITVVVAIRQGAVTIVALTTY